MELNILLLQIQFSIFTLIAIFLRKGMRHLPKKYSYMLWIFVFARFLWPFSIDSQIGIMPEQSVVMSVMDKKFDVGRAEKVESVLAQDGVAAIAGGNGQSVTMDMQGIEEAEPEKGINWVEPLLVIGWITGMVTILLYNALALKKMRKHLNKAKCIRDNIFVSSQIATPFTFGMKKLRIYLPDFLEEKEQQYIICHEQIHIRRKDYLVKNAAFVLACMNWFNPLVWVAFHYLEQDMEMSCDEEVIRTMGNGIKKEYSQSLLDFAIGQRNKALTPVTFGEVSVKQRVGNVLTKKSTKGWIGVIVLLGCVMGLISALFICAPRTINSTSSELFGGKIIAVNDEVNTFVNDWASAFCQRDIAYVGNHTTLKTRKSLEREGLLSNEDGESYFGWSSPWPYAEEELYRIIEASNEKATILYYAWTSDPHIRVWRETITFKKDKKSGYLITNESTTFLEGIAIEADFFKAYPDGVLVGTPMDYAVNGLGEVLNENVKDDPLLMPAKAAVELLNLSNKTNHVKATLKSQKKGEAIVSILFVGEKSKVTVKMTQPFGKDGIWVPQEIVD